MILRLALLKAKELNIGKAIISCLKDNIGSHKIIEKNGGILTAEYCENNKEYNMYSIIL